MGLFQKFVRLSGRLRCSQSGAPSCSIAVILLALISPQTNFAQSPPVIVSVTPTNSATDGAMNSTIVFVFDQNMKTTVTTIRSISGFYVGNFEIQPRDLNATGSWGADKGTLTLKPDQGYGHLKRTLYGR